MKKESFYKIVDKLNESDINSFNFDIDLDKEFHKYSDNKIKEIIENILDTYGIKYTKRENNYGIVYYSLLNKLKDVEYVIRIFFFESKMFVILEPINEITDNIIDTPKELILGLSKVTLFNKLNLTIMKKLNSKLNENLNPKTAFSDLSKEECKELIKKILDIYNVYYDMEYSHSNDVLYYETTEPHGDYNFIIRFEHYEEEGINEVEFEKRSIEWDLIDSFDLTYISDLTYFLGKYVKNYSADLMLKINQKPINEDFVNDIRCEKCGWEWVIEDKDEEPYLCHKCGYDNDKNIYEPEKLKEWEESIKTFEQFNNIS
jgi:ribosomal protein L37AE/L43A